MTPEEYEQLVNDLFHAASELPTEEREMFLNQNCPDDSPEVRLKVLAMLGAKPIGHPVPMPGMEELSKSQPLDPMIGRQIGGYVIRKVAGKGGYGTVYRAERTGRVQEQVAIKLIRSEHVADDRVRRRFDDEQQTLADVRHEYIAQMFASGATEEGWPYIVMEYIEGQPITEYSDAHKLSIDERLKLFQKVCAAVSYAHDMEYVHRDIKPSNILVDAKGVPKLLDFGIAKLIDPRHRKRMVTLTEEGILGTPEYASPEQLRGDRAISTATDVYSLGVVLYELLTGHYPYRFKDFLVSEIQRVICEEEPDKPSTIVFKPAKSHNRDGSSRTLDPDQISATRKSTPAGLRRKLHGDLEIILLKAMHKERERRYSSPEAMAQDIENLHLGLPIKARPDSKAYRIRKFIRRNRGLVSSAASLMAVLITALVVTGKLAKSNSDLAMQYLAINNQLHERNKEITEKTERSAKNEKLARDGILELVDACRSPTMLRLAPETQEIRGNLLLSAISYWQRYVDANSPGGEPEDIFNASMQIGRLQSDLGHFDEAEVAYCNASDIASRRGDLLGMCQAHNDLAIVYLRVNRESEAREVLRRAAETLKAKERDGSEVEMLLAKITSNLAQLEIDAGEVSSALNYVNEAVSTYESLVQGDWRLNRLLGGTLQVRARIRKRLDDFDQAIEEYTRSLAVLRSLKMHRDDASGDHVTAVNEEVEQLIAASLYGLAELQMQTGRNEESEENHKQAIAALEALVHESPYLIESKFNLGIAYNNCAALLMQTGNREEAEGWLKKSLKVRLDLLENDGGNNVIRKQLATTYSNLGAIAERNGDHSLALQQLKNACEHLESIPSDKQAQFNLASNLGDLASLYINMKQLKTAEDLLDRSMMIFGRVKRHDAFGKLCEANSVYQFARLRKEQGEFKDASDLASQAVAALENASPLRSRSDYKQLSRRIQTLIEELSAVRAN